MSFQIIETNRGFPCLVLNSYKYRKLRHAANGEIVWRCTRKSCIGTVRTDYEITKVLNVRAHHEHAGIEPTKLQEMVLCGQRRAHIKKLMTRVQIPASRMQPAVPLSTRDPLSIEPWSVPVQSELSVVSDGKEVPQQGQVAQQKQLVQQTPPQAPPALKKAPPSPQTAAAPKPAVPKQPPPPPPRPVSPPQPPPPPPEVCLRWNSYHSNMQATFPSLLNNEQFVDVTLACEGRSIKCHKMMLSACSAYFEELLSQNPCQHPIVLMKDLRYWEVQALVDFMYRGEVNVGQDKLPSLLAAAEALQIKGLAGPASTSSSHDEDSLPSTLPPNSTDDYNMDESIPSPSSARRARKRRVMSSLPASQPLQPVPVTVPRNTVSRTRIPRASDPLPSTSSYQPDVVLPMSSEPPQRRPRRSEASDYLGHEIKIEPVDIDISNDSMDHGDDSYLDKGYDESGAVDEGGGDSSCQGDGGSVGGSNGGLVDHKTILTRQDSDQVDYGSNNGLESNVTGDRTGSDTKPQAFKYESGTSRDTTLSSAPDIPSVAYPEVVMNPSSSSGTGSSSGENLGDSMMPSM